MIRTLTLLCLAMLSTPAFAESAPARISGDKILLNDKVHFEYDSEGIQRQSTPVLQDLARLMNNQPSIKVVEIRGHTDANGTMSYNQDLSTRRADEVARFLVDHGVEANRIRIRGYGESRPLYSGTGERIDEANRRVEFVILKRG
jgi:outer membrane protein OmpA-like peptidoglycan-associated protein